MSYNQLNTNENLEIEQSTQNYNSIVECAKQYRTLVESYKKEMRRLADENAPVSNRRIILPKLQNLVKTTENKLFSMLEEI